LNFQVSSQIAALGEMISQLTMAVDRMNKSLEAALPGLRSGSELPANATAIPESSEMYTDDPSTVEDKTSQYQKTRNSSTSSTYTIT
jgi:hypothetical protein